MRNNDQTLQKSCEFAEAHAKPVAERSTSNNHLHELQMHQTELEMQNEELRKSHIALKASCAHYIELYDFAPIGYLTLTTQGIIAEVNLSAAKLLGAERKYLINSRFVKFIADRDLDRWSAFFPRIMHRNKNQSVELILQRSDGTFFHAQLDCRCTELESHSQLLLIALTDITERKQVEEERRVAAAAFETQEGIIVSDEKKMILRVNNAFCQITGYNAEEVKGKETGILRSGQHDENFYDAIWESIEVVGYWQGEVWLRRKNGDIFPSWLTWTAVTGGDGSVTHYVASLSDVTIQKRAEQMLIESRCFLANQVASTKEELTKVKEEKAEVNTALNVVLKHRESDKTEAQILLSREIETIVLPILEKLNKVCAGQFQGTHLLSILDANLQAIVKSYGHNDNLAATYQKLSPVERHVASMVRQGLSSKTIATVLNISAGTVSSHRKHIRKKLGLDGKKINLISYLSSLIE